MRSSANLLVRPRVLNILILLRHRRIITADPAVLALVVLIVVVAREVITFQTTAINRQRPHPPNKRDTAKQAPRKHLALGLDPCRQREQRAGREGPEAAACGG